MVFFKGIKGKDYVTDLSDKQLKIGYWWVTHKSQLKKWRVIVLVVVNALIILYVLFNMVFIVAYWARDSKIPEKMAAINVNFAGYQQKNKPQDIKVIDQFAIPQDQTNEVYDLIAKIENPNEKWASENLQYSFQLGTAVTDLLTTRLMPGETKYLVAYNLEPETAVADPKLVIENMNWKRIERPAELPVVDLLVSEINSQRIRLQGIAAYSFRVSAKITNMSIYSLKKVSLIVVLKSGSRVIGFKETSLENLESFSQRDTEVVWKSGFVQGTNAEVIPWLDLLDESNFYIHEDL